MQSIEIDEANPYYISINGVLYNKDTTRIVCYPISNSTRYGEMSFPESVKTIGSNVFRDVDFEVNLPVNLDSIESYAFGGYNQDSIEIPATVKYLGKGAFLESNLVFVDMSETSISELADSVFYGSGLQKAILPPNVTAIGNYAFGECKQTNDIGYNPGIQSISIPATVAKIGKGAFFNCTDLYRVTFHQTLN